MILGLNQLRKVDPKIASSVVKQLYDTALIQSNIPAQNKEFVKRSFSLLNTLTSMKLNSQGNAQSEEPVVERLKEEYINCLT